MCPAIATVASRAYTPQVFSAESLRISILAAAPKIVHGLPVFVKFMKWQAICFHFQTLEVSVGVHPWTAGVHGSLFSECALAFCFREQKNEHDADRTL